jgi:hypothetical protein
MHLDNSILATWPCPAADVANLFGGTIIGVQLVQVSIPNQTLTFLSNCLYSSGATLILTRLQYRGCELRSRRAAAWGRRLSLPNPHLSARARNTALAVR